MNIRQNVSLKNYNTFGINVIAKYFFAFNELSQLQTILEDKKYRGEQKLILGGGSNILFTQNFDGLIIHNQLKGIELINEDTDYYYIKAAAGEVWHNLVMHCVNNNYAGLENLSLIPGYVGASPIQNIGAYGVEMKDVFYCLDAWHIHQKEIHTLTKQDCKFAYRDSIFKNKCKGEYIILSVVFRLYKKPVLNYTYGAIKEELEKMNITEIGIKEISRAVINIRSSKLPDPSLIGNAGSFFKNPEVPAHKYLELKQKHPDIAAYSLGNGNHKIAAAWMIEKAGWKGKKFENCYGVHDKQALVLVNFGCASGLQIAQLSDNIRQDIKQKFGIELECEVNII
jgi:UDP-N-acetylmuramate dehydrogenase